MAVLDTTQFNQLVQQVREALLAGSQGVGEIEVVTTLAGLVSLPALRMVGATETVVEAPLELLAAPAVEAAANAIEATDRAIVAVEEVVKTEKTISENETERKRLEGIRVNAENDRVRAENTRQTDENLRKAAEVHRNNAELSRGTSETKRRGEFDTIKKEAVGATGKANTQAERAKQQADNPSKIGDNGYWWKWDEAEGKYIDTGVLANGSVLYPTFTIDPDTMELIMHYQDDIVADMFAIDNDGHLTFNPK